MSEQDPKLVALTTLLQLQKAARQAKSRERLGFVICNESHRLLRYQQALVWTRQPLRVHTLSGLAVIDQNAPYTQWLEQLLEQLQHHPRATSPTQFTADDFPTVSKENWKAFAPEHFLHHPFIKNGELHGGLIMMREAPWEEAETALLDMLGDAYAHAWFAQTGKLEPKQHSRLRRAIPWLLGGTLVIGSALPVKMSVLAPAEVIPLAPWVVAAPQQGIIKQLAVKPNQPVQRGDLLFEYDDTRARNALEVARKALAVAEAEYSRARQRAFTDAQSKGEAGELKARREQARAELAYNQDLLQRSRIHAQRDGIAVFSNADDWTGKPVSVGERVMTIASTDETQLQVWLPAADAFAANTGARVRFFRNTHPDSPLTAQLSQTSFEAELSPQGNLAFRLRAHFNDSQHPRLGVHGTARVDGEDVSLIYYLMRRPLATLRQWLGW